MNSIVLALILFFASDDFVTRGATANDDGAIAELRAMGQPGVDALMQWRESRQLDAEAQRRFETAIDRVCRQRDCAWSGLYWYTDLEEAKAVAQREHKPILTLRLLGNLDEELSCANSRFFRTILYSNRDISAYLRANYILHWQSVRPVPVVTIDFGDGRVMTRTLTGNSIHYVIAPDGTIVDALPGLYAPKAFLAQLQEMRQVYAGYERDPASLTVYHAQRGRNLAVKTASADAWKAAPLAVSKMAVEKPVLNVVVIGKALPPTRRVAAPASGEEIDDHSKQLILLKRANGYDFDAMLKALNRTLIADTEYNESTFHPTIHSWLASGTVKDLDAFNRRVYDELFLTPDSDRWLGLLPSDVFTAIDGDGITATSVAPADKSARRLSDAPAQSARSRR